jgi:uroporphyrinogen decarboxylase
MMSQSLTPRERVLLALSHEETDRVPVDFLATFETRTRLGKFLGINESGEILRRLGVDLRHPRQPYVGPLRRVHEGGDWSDEWGVRRRRVAHSGGSYDEIVCHPLACLEGIDDFAGYPWPDPAHWDVDALEAEIRALDAENTYAIALEEFGDPGGIFEIAWYLRGMEQLLCDMAERPELAYVLMERVTDCLLGRLERVMARLGGRIDLIWTSDDIAHQHGPLISPKLWSELVAPHHERFNRRTHELGTRVMYHSCGAVRPFIPGLIAIGVDVLDVLQFSARGMVPEEIKASFGDRLSFHGGVDVQVLLPRGTSDEVFQRVRELICVMGKGGGFVLSPCHNIQLDTPPENILAIYRAAGSLSQALPDKGRR